MIAAALLVALLIHAFADDVSTETPLPQLVATGQSSSSRLGEWMPTSLAPVAREAHLRGDAWKSVSRLVLGEAAEEATGGHIQQ